MRMFRYARWLLLTLLLALIPASSHAQIVISVGFAPPELPVYEQPVCPEPNLMWMPGYWAYDQDQGDYYWVPGAWVPAPYEGALWTPPYWGWSNGNYGFYDGYWGPHVGYYGGMNYGFGYGGIGFAGGEWRGHDFAYNTAVVHVDETVIHTTYVDRTIVENNTIVNNNHVSYSRGPGGVQHQPTAAEQVAAHDQHSAPTSVQTQHVAAAKTDKTSFAKANGGHPQNAVVAKPLGPEKATPAPGPKAEAKTEPPSQVTPAKQVAQPATPAQHPAPKQQAPPAPKQQARPAPQQQAPPAPKQQARPAPQQQSRPAPQQQARPAPQQQARPAPQQQARPAPQQQARPAPQQQARPAPAPQQHAAPAPKNEPKH